MTSTSSPTTTASRNPASYSLAPNGAASPTDADWCVDLDHVAKTYRGKIRALDGISMRVARGEIFGLLGPNGAGKSTLVKIMTTIVRPTCATGSILGKPLGHKPTLARVGYLPEHHRFPWYLTGRQVLDFYAALSGVPRTERRTRAARFLQMVGMTDWADRRVDKYSKGMMQRVGLAQALMNDPDLVILDEPTDGVDPVGRSEIRAMLLELRDEGKTIFLNSHMLSEVERVCTRVAILVQGRVAAQGTIDELTRDSVRYEIEHAGTPRPWVSEVRGLSIRSKPGERACLAIPGNDPTLVQPIIDRLRAESITIHRVERTSESLEDLFIRSVQDPRTGKPHRPGAAPSPGASS